MSKGNETLSSFDYINASDQVTLFFSGVRSATEKVHSNFQQLFYSLDVAMGVVGICANTLLFAFLFFNKKLRKNTCNVLILNQTAIDLFASIIMALTYTVKLRELYYASGWTRFYCRIFDSNATLGIAVNGSITCLMVISLERYMKICHAIWHKNRFSSWMQKTALAFPWIYPTITSFPVLVITTDVENGRCMIIHYWSTLWVRQAYAFGNTVWKFVLPIGVFVVCYTKILIQMKEQGRIHAHSMNNTSHNALIQSEKNIVVMLLYVVAFYVVSYTPVSIYYTLYNLNIVSLSGSPTYSILLSTSYLNMCANPIIYAVKYQVFGSVVSKLRQKIRVRDIASSQRTSTAGTI